MRDAYLRDANAFVRVDAGNFMRKAITALEITIASALLIGLAAYGVQGLLG